MKNNLHYLIRGGKMTVQQLCDELTSLSHKGLAQAEVNFLNDYEVKSVEQVLIIDEETIELKGME